MIDKSLLENLLGPTEIATVPDKGTSCLMCDAIYIKANGELPCWCSWGETKILGELDMDELCSPTFDLANSLPLLSLRQVINVEQRWLFPDRCSKCTAKRSGVPVTRSLERRHLEILHLEPSYLCNLDCPVCVPRASRKKRKRPPYHMSPEMWRAVVDNLRRNRITVGHLHMEGRGDPLMNQDISELIGIFHDVYPDTTSELTTNGNFCFDPTLFERGLKRLRISVDGAREESYQRYRRGGTFAKPHLMMQQAAEWRARTNKQVVIEWKYILFEWNDSPEEMKEAYAIAESLGLELAFFITSGYGASKRYDNNSLQMWIAENTPNANSKYNPSTEAPPALVQLNKRSDSTAANLVTPLS